MPYRPIVPFDPRDTTETASNAMPVARGAVVHPVIRETAWYVMDNNAVSAPVPFQIRPVHSAAFETKRRHRYNYDGNTAWGWRRLFANTSIQTSFRAYKLQNDGRYTARSRMAPVARYKKVVAYPRSVASPPQYGPGDSRPPKPLATGWIRTVEGLTWKLGGTPNVR